MARTRGYERQPAREAKHRRAGEKQWVAQGRKREADQRRKAEEEQRWEETMAAVRRASELRAQGKVDEACAVLYAAARE